MNDAQLPEGGFKVRAETLVGGWRLLFVFTVMPAVPTAAVTLLR